MIPRLRHLAAAALSGALLLLPALAGTPSAAATTGSALAPDPTYSVDMARTEAQMEAVARYWQPEKLKLAENYTPATPGSRPKPTGTTTASSQSLGLARRPVPDARTVPPAPPAAGGAARTFGKVYFLISGKEYWCSASAVAAKNRSVVATAGHCAYDLKNLRPADNWIFVPNPGTGGTTPDGIYIGATLNIHDVWSGEGDYDYDYAFITVHSGFRWETKDGKPTRVPVGKLQDNVGGQGLTILRGVGNQAVAFGYPSGAQPDGTRPFDGRTLATCDGRTTKTRSPSFNLEHGVQLPGCNFSHGASGGPWLLEFDAGKKLGWLNGVNSLTWNRDAKGTYDAVSSSYFNSGTMIVYQRAANAS
ncbi:hypothetical protein [Nonomuraea sp. NPDC050310]|uniref:trypsin-like serine peptidase n=1 Tax=Nonomuraea sp. NPDC050310 TaxID=3154935 RepID=UPI0033D077FF